MEFLHLIKILLRRIWIFLAVFLLFFLLFAAGALLITPTYQAVAKLFVQSSSALTSLMSALEMPSAAVNDSSEDIFETKTALAKIRPLLDELIADLKLQDRDGATIKAEDLLEAGLVNKLLPQPAVTVKQQDDTAVLKITATSPDAAQAAKISNTLAELYLAHNVRRTQAEFVKVKAFINAKLTALYENYSRSLADLTAFKVEANAADLDTTLGNALSRLNDLIKSQEDNEQSLTLLEKEIASTQAQLEKIGKYRKETSEFSKNEELAGLRTKLNDLLVSLSAKGAVYQPSHPEYQQIEKELQAVRDLVKQQEKITLNRENMGVDPVYDSLTDKIVGLQISRDVGLAKRALLQRGIDEYERKVAEFPGKSAKLAQLELALSASKGVYETFLSYLRKVEVAEAVAMSDTRIVEPAQTPEKKKFPKKGLMLAAGLCLGLFWGGAAAFFAEYIDTAVWSPAELPDPDCLLGCLPRSRQVRQLANLPPASPLAESVRTLRHSIKFAAGDRPATIILVTGCSGGEGASSVAAHLALSFAAVGRKALLVDLSLRRPVLHRWFGRSGKQGLAEVLQGKLTAPEAIAADAAPGLDLLPAGRTPAVLGALLEAPALPELLRSFASKYEAVVLDAPPLLAGSDVLLLGAEVDWLLCVAECGRTDRQAAAEAQRRLRQAGISRAGWVLNKCGGGCGRS
ncbi:MAG: GumC family protein [Candidatus Electronema sp. V4]|uniref:GumC family protein n=1 Tax=Candidatus Electronema sp. V4 TaxID=3454756 RepID=UPI0040556859